MTVDIVVLGAGYGGTAAIRSLEDELGDRAEISLTWASRRTSTTSCSTSHTV